MFGETGCRQVWVDGDRRVQGGGVGRGVCGGAGVEGGGGETEKGGRGGGTIVAGITPQKGN